LTPLVLQPEGGKLGFPFCQTYDHTSPNFGEEVESLLRGEDAALFATARALGIRVAAQRIWRVRRKHPGARSSWGSGPHGETVLMVGHFGAPKFFKEYSYKDEKYVHMDPFEFIEALGGKVDPEITWVRGKKISADFTDWKLGAWNGIGSGGGCDSDAETDGMEGTMTSTIGLWHLGDPPCQLFGGLQSAADSTCPAVHSMHGILCSSLHARCLSILAHRSASRPLA
jgi:hypothetical protein